LKLEKENRRETVRSDEVCWWDNKVFVYACPVHQQKKDDSLKENARLKLIEARVKDRRRHLAERGSNWKAARTILKRLKKLGKVAHGVLKVRQRQCFVQKERCKSNLRTG